MEDIEVPAGGDEGNPGSPEAEAPSTVEETAAPDGDAQADETEGDPKEEGADEAAPDDGHGGAFDKLLAKYGGDKDKMADAYFEQANSNSRLWEKLQGIEEYIKGQQRTEVDETKLVEADPDVKEIAKEYNDTQSEIQATTQKQDKLISQYGVLERKIENLRGKLEVVSDYEAKAEIRDKLNEAVADQKSVQNGIESSQRDVKRLSTDLKKLHATTRQHRPGPRRTCHGKGKRSGSVSKKLRPPAGSSPMPCEGKPPVTAFSRSRSSMRSSSSRSTTGSTRTCRGCRRGRRASTSVEP